MTIINVRSKSDDMASLVYSAQHRKTPWRQSGRISETTAGCTCKLSVFASTASVSVLSDDWSVLYVQLMSWKVRTYGICIFYTRCCLRIELWLLWLVLRSVCLSVCLLAYL